MTRFLGRTLAALLAAALLAVAGLALSQANVPAAALLGFLGLFCTCLLWEDS